MTATPAVERPELAAGAVHQGDAFTAALPADADLLLTDPPYGISRPTGFTSTRDRRYAGYKMSYGAWDAAPAVADLAGLAASTLRRGGTAAIFFGWRQVGPLADALEAAGFSKIRLAIWRKSNPVPVNTRSCYLSNARELAVVAVRGDAAATFNSHYDAGDYDLPLQHAELHPTQKPLELMAELVRKHSRPGDLVVDPFAGSGTTLLAAQHLGRRWLGVEARADYCEVARSRLAAELDL